MAANAFGVRFVFLVFFYIFYARLLADNINFRI